MIRRASDAVAGTATDFQRSIGVEGKGGSRRVAGVDITVPQFAFTVTRVMATASVNTAFTQMLVDLTGTVNVASHTLAGLSFDGDVHGQSILPLASGQTSDWRDDLMCETHGHGHHHIGRLVVTDRYKYVANKGDMDELYDLSADRSERTNVYRRHPDVVKQMQALLEHCRKAKRTAPLEG